MRGALTCQGSRLIVAEEARVRFDSDATPADHGRSDFARVAGLRIEDWTT